MSAGGLLWYPFHLADVCTIRMVHPSTQRAEHTIQNSMYFIIDVLHFDLNFGYLVIDVIDFDLNSGYLVIDALQFDVNPSYLVIYDLNLAVDTVCELQGLSSCHPSLIKRQPVQSLQRIVHVFPSHKLLDKFF